MKKSLIFKTLYLFLVLIVIAGASVFATNTYLASQISYGNTNVEDALNGLFELKGNDENYSTKEKIIGKWIDGKPIYRKVAIKSEDLTNLNIDYTLKTTIIYCDSINHPQIKYTCETFYQNGGFGVICYVNDYKSGFTYNEYGGANIDYIIFEYTKTTD